MQGPGSRRIIVDRRPRHLRNNATDAERKLWQHLRGRQLEGSKFRRQHPFEDFVLDFVCLDGKIVVELDGGQHADRTAYDEARSRRLKTFGFVVLRFWNNEVFDNIEGVVQVIADALRLQANPSPPNPPLEGEG